MQDINLAARILGHWKCLMIQIYVQNHLYNFIYIYIHKSTKSCNC